MRNLLKKFFIFMIFSSCKPQSSLTQRSDKQFLPDTNQKSSLSQDEKKQIKSNVMSGLPSDSSIAQLKNLTIPELKLYFEEQKQQNIASSDDLEITEALNSALCQKVNDIRKNCPAIRRIIPTGFATLLQCHSTSVSNQNNNESIEVILSSIDQSTNDFKFSLLANDTYQSSVFQFGVKTLINFKSIGGSDLLSPKFLNLYKISLTRDDPSQELPDIKSLKLEIYSGGQLLLKSGTYQSDDPKKEKTEYKLDVSPIISMRESSKCKVSSESLNAYKATVIDAVKENQKSKRTEEYMKSQEDHDQ